jgi:hypothetical protein
MPFLGQGTHLDNLKALHSSYEWNLRHSDSEVYTSFMLFLQKSGSGYIFLIYSYLLFEILSVYQTRREKREIKTKAIKLFLIEAKKSLTFLLKVFFTFLVEHA